MNTWGNLEKVNCEIQDDRRCEGHSPPQTQEASETNTEVMRSCNLSFTFTVCYLTNNAIDTTTTIANPSLLLLLYNNLQFKSIQGLQGSDDDLV
ncbi:hypothetical protein E2C01_047871 [Portunus trituberculatus]|uniref:Uncharacterized protein n=1 Tax=Portunus trituberculatus TaxID=210409 RepID=A0A5B7G914_PORTR|nr:hypothetical protein [Portunus trituberculatus]